MKNFLLGVGVTLLLEGIILGYIKNLESRQEACDSYGVFTIDSTSKSKEGKTHSRVWVNGKEVQTVDDSEEPFPNCITCKNPDGTITLLRNVEVPDWWKPQPGQKARLKASLLPWGKRTMLPEGVKLD